MSDSKTAKVNSTLTKICLAYQEIISDTNAVLYVLEEDTDGKESELRNTLKDFRNYNIARLQEVQGLLDALRIGSMDLIPDSSTRH